MKGSGIANTCPVIEGGSSNLKDLKAGSYTINKLCMEPTSFRVKEESQFKGGDTDFVATKLMTRLTYTLDEVSLESYHPTTQHNVPGQVRLCGTSMGESRCCLRTTGSAGHLWWIRSREGDRGTVRVVRM